LIDPRAAITVGGIGCVGGDFRAL